MIRISLNPVPYRCSDGDVIYWEYEIEEYFRSCMISLQEFAGFLERVLREAVTSETLEGLHLSFEEGRIKIWLPFSRFSDDLFHQIELLLRERLRTSFEELL
ncbi:MAG TPA: hypothetical protein VLH40_10305 [Atribacteraceae bacterium]|nr:hypothetical protein [Atribacteraceae bacterium]